MATSKLQVYGCAEPRPLRCSSRRTAPLRPRPRVYRRVPRVYVCTLVKHGRNGPARGFYALLRAYVRARARVRVSRSSSPILECRRYPGRDTCPRANHPRPLDDRAGLHPCSRRCWNFGLEPIDCLEIVFGILGIRIVPVIVDWFYWLRRTVPMIFALFRGNWTGCRAARVFRTRRPDSICISANSYAE